MRARGQSHGEGSVVSGPTISIDSVMDIVFAPFAVEQTEQARALLNSSAFGGAHSWHHADLSAEKPGSCQDWRDAGADADGLFFIFPANDTFHEVHCDQITDGGGWMLTWAYTHASGSDGNLNSPSIPLNPWTSYGNFFLHDYRKLLWFHGDLLAMNESNVFWI